MKEHFCPAEQSIIAYEGKCNWCGQKEWVGLTDEDIDQLHTAWVLEGGFLKLCDDIEAKLKDKNT